MRERAQWGGREGGGQAAGAVQWLRRSSGVGQAERGSFSGGTTCCSIRKHHQNLLLTRQVESTWLCVLQQVSKNSANPFPSKFTYLKLAHVASDQSAVLALAIHECDVFIGTFGQNFRVSAVWALNEAFSRLQCGHGNLICVHLEVHFVRIASECFQDHFSGAHRAFDERGEIECARGRVAESPRSNPCNI